MLVSAFRDRFCTLSGSPPSDEKIAETKRKREVELADAAPQKKFRAAVVPSMCMGVGEPISVRKGVQSRLFVDGGGLCSKGLWPPERRSKTTKLGQQIFQQVLLAMRENDSDPEVVLRRIARGGLEADPFPQEVLDDAKAGIVGLVRDHLAAWVPSGVPLSLNIDVKVMGVLLREFGDPGWEVFHSYEVGVRLGVGINMHRTPQVFPEKVKWNVPGQEDVDIDKEFVGTRCSNYPSAENQG